jgi:hypothetical protein
LLLCAVLSAVSVAVTGVLPLTETDVEAVPTLPNVQVTASVGLVRAVVTAQERFTVPVNPSEGVTVMVEVFALVAPGLIVIFPLFVSTKPEATAVLTVADAVPVAPL